MALCQDPDKYKMLAGDTGLFVTLAFWNKKFADNTIYHKLPSGRLSNVLGYVYENVIAQMRKQPGMSCMIILSPLTAENTTMKRIS